MKHLLASALLLAALFATPFASAQAPTRPPARPPARPAAPPSLAGIYQTIPNDETLPGGLKNTGGPDAITLTPAAIELSKTSDLTEEASKLCLPVGPFRMMARDGVKIELVNTPETIVMLFEDVSHGYLRTIHMNRPHLKTFEPSWMGDSTGRWEGRTLVVDTIGFNDRTWLNAHGAQHSDALHLVERIRPLPGNVLEYRVTATDPKALARPSTYVRYYRKLATDVMAEDFCEAELN